MRRLAVVIRVMMGAALFAGLALADYEALDFGIPGSQPGSASISYAGGAAPLVASGIKVSDILSKGSPLNNGSDFACDSCTLSFTTGSFAGQTGGGLLLLFSGGGSFSLTGRVAAAGINSTTTLLSGVFDASTVVSFQPLGSSFKIASALFGNDINTALAGFFGLPPTPPLYNGNLSFGFNAPTQADGSFSATGSNIGSGDLTTTVPEPISILLLGTVLLGCAGIARRMVVH